MSQGDVSTCSAPQIVFQEAVKQGNTKELHSLLQNMTNCEFNVNSFGPEGQTALHQSVIDGNLELVKLLVKFGADIRLANREGWSALHIAAFGGHQDIVLYLITKVEVSLRLHVSMDTHQTHHRRGHCHKGDPHGWLQRKRRKEREEERKTSTLFCNQTEL
uniref:Notch-regulated ankyrin repeat-containing protein n=1 Tax=Oncorhynchus tshawytscha TaxID=74940 RepID=A0AAZ3SA00_ONCTS